jgi:site-specific DNA recombinase
LHHYRVHWRREVVVTMTKRALGVVRLSELVDDTTSPERQKEIIKAKAAQRDGEVVAWATDLDVSATKYPPTKRPELARWLAQPEAYDEVIFWRIDRFVRSPADLTDMIRWSKDNRKGLLSATESFDLDDPLGEAMAYLASIFAKMESTATSIRVAGAHEYLRRNKRWGGGRPPYGYMVIANPDGNGKVLTIDPVTSEVVREAVRRVIAGESVSAVSADFNHREIPSPHAAFPRKGKPEGPLWGDSSLRMILRDKALLGHVVHKGESVLGDDGMPIICADPIVTPDEWTDLQAAIEKASQTHARSDTPSLLLNVAFCAVCQFPHAPLYRWSKHNYQKLADGTRAKYGPFNYYRCKRSYNLAYQRKDCESKLIRVDALDALVRDWVASKYDTPEYREVAILRDNLDIQIKAVNDAMTSLTAQLTREVISDDEYDAMMASLRAERASLRDQQAERERQPAPTEPEKTGRTIAEAFAAMGDDVAQQRAWLLSYDVKVLAGRNEDGELYAIIDARGVYGLKSIDIIGRPPRNDLLDSVRANLALEAKSN